MSDLHEEVKKIFVDPKVSQKIVELVTSDKPAGWSNKSNAPYYKRVYAEEIRPFIDNMMKDGQDILYRYSTWCTDTSGVSRATLYNRINQSIRYLVERLDPQHIYSEWLERVVITRQSDVGVIISYVPGLGPNGGNVPTMKPESVVPKVARAIWERKMDEWLEDETNYEPFVKEGLALSQQEVVNLIAKVAQLSNVQYSITESYVKLIKIA